MKDTIVKGWLEDLNDLYSAQTNTYDICAQAEATTPGIHADECASVNIDTDLQAPNASRKRRVSSPSPSPSPLSSTLSKDTRPHTHPKRQRQAYKELDHEGRGEEQGYRGRGRSRSHIASKYTAAMSTPTPSLPKLTAATTLGQSSVTSGSASKRSRSPARKVQDLKNAVPPTCFFAIGHTGVALPDAAEDLRNQATKARRLKGLLDGSIRLQVTPYLDPCDAQDDDLFNDKKDPQSLEILAVVQRVVRNTTRCVEDGKSEASWGEEVIRPLLDLAASMTGDRATIENITAMNIHPKTLLPTGPGIVEFPLEGKRVDYGMYLEPTETEAKKIAYLHRESTGPDDLGLNQTRGYLQDKPLLWSAEMKKTVSGHDPLLQIGIWNSALFQRLEQLFERRRPGIKMSDILPIPAIVIRGPAWELYASYIVDEDDRGRVLRGLVDIGSTSTVIGVYQILKVLEAVTRYGVDRYWPWLSEALLE
ncbi:hypothetical protein DL95DRAFT_526791 [Leptodontidium sp. 2 PMI_412]|nr:hypothetical protein DL95DRAFT_526791 [Leptodontidium sp. 2 PMI_412]